MSMADVLTLLGVPDSSRGDTDSGYDWIYTLRSASWSGPSIDPTLDVGFTSGRLVRAAAVHDGID